MDDKVWQNGDFHCCTEDQDNMGVPNFVFRSQGTPGVAAATSRYECRGPGIFGFFLPLMTILGEIADLHHARNHPRLRQGARCASEWNVQAEEIRDHIHTYERSLASFEQSFLSDLAGALANEQGQTVSNRDGPSFVDTNGRSRSHSPRMLAGRGTNGAIRLTDCEIHASVVVAYGAHVVHVLHILLAGKWDPIGLLDDHDMWISSPAFFQATNHAVSAADALGRILDFDPGLEFMPFFFGIYLLQGSFLPLLMADKLGLEASPNVVQACETIVRAHEVCVATLNTEYQRNFSKVMRGALAVVRGRATEDGEEHRQRWRELLGLYRWTGDGTGLAL
ncbi:hypothetical protein HIM_02695 [Hirsutella minnesotensis 3608]|nr:hypothetical protein HIM_02695 [Hirsutella minnesotensis 3608]